MGVNNISGAEILMKKLDTNGDGRVDKNDNLNEQIQKELGLNEDKSYTKENIENVSDKLAKLGGEVENLTKGAEKPQMGISQEEKGVMYEVQPAIEMPTTGDYYAEVLPDGTSVRYELQEDGTEVVRKFDAKGNEIKKSDQPQKAASAEKPQMGISQEDGWYEVQPALEKPTTGDIYAERLPDGTSLQYDFKEKTVTKYDADDNVMFEMSIQEYENQKIEDKIKNLKSGESMQYEERQSISAPGISSSERNTVNVTRKENGELVETRLGVVYGVSYPRMQGVRLNTTYDKNHENKISEDFVDSEKSQWGVVSTKHFENGEPSSVVTDLSNLNEGLMTFDFLRTLSNSLNNYSSQQLKNADGEVVLIVEDGKFYKVKANGKKKDNDIGDGRAWKIVNKLRDKNELGELIQEY